MKSLLVILLLVLLSGCSDGIADSDEMSDLKQYVEEVNSRRPKSAPEFSEGCCPWAPTLPVFTPDDDPFDGSRVNDTNYDPKTNSPKIDSGRGHSQE